MAQQPILRALFPIVCGFGLLFFTAALALWLTVRQNESASWVQHTLEVEARLAQVLALAVDAETGQRGFLLSGRDIYLGPYATARQDLLPAIARLEAETADNPVQRASVQSLRALAGAKLQELKRSIDLRAANDQDGALAVLNGDSGIRLMDDFRSIIARMRGEEERLLRERTEAARHNSSFALAALIISTFLILGLAVVAVWRGREQLLALRLTVRQLETEARERVAAEGQVRQLQRMDAVGQLTGGIAHDFNNMLAIIIGSLDLLRRRLKGDEDSRIFQYLDNARQGADRAAALTSRLLAFARRQALDPKVIDANKFVSNLSELLRRVIGEQVQVETVLAGGLWRTRADGAQLENAIVNLAANARDAMSNGGKLTIETANTFLDEEYAKANLEVKAGQYVLISVSDTGMGMPPDVIEKAFEPFFTTKIVGKGTGLGLSQVFGFVKQSGGHVKIYSEPGHGTSVKIYLPRQSDANSPTDLLSPAIEASMPSGSPGEIVLVVEDEAEVRTVTVDALRELGYTVLHSSGPTAALQQLEEKPGVVLLLTDIVMPEMTGRQMADKALSRLPDLKVLYMTGYTRNAVVHNGVLDHGTNFLAKPFTLAQLASKTREVLDAG